MRRLRVLAPFVALALAAGCTTDDGEPKARSPVPASPSPREQVKTTAAIAAEGYSITARVEPRSIGPLRLSVRNLRKAKRNDARPWLDHDLVLRNVGDKKLHFGDTRTSRYLEPGKRLLGADEGCGYGKARGKPIDVGACASYLELLDIAPGESKTKEITLFKELRGMQEMKLGVYEFHKKLKFGVGKGRRSPHSITIVYEVALT